MHAISNIVNKRSNTCYTSDKSHYASRWRLVKGLQGMKIKREHSNSPRIRFSDYTIRIGVLISPMWQKSHIACGYIFTVPSVQVLTECAK